MSQDHAFVKVELGAINDSKINSLSIYSDYLITGDDKGNVASYEITSKNKTSICQQQFLQKSKVEQILTLPNQNISFALCSGDIYVLMIPKMSTEYSTKKENIEKIFLNKYDNSSRNVILAITKKKKVKLFDYDPRAHTLSEKQRNKDLSVEEVPMYADWVDNKLVYAIGGKSVAWLDLNLGKISSVDFDKPKQIINLGGKVALANEELTLFMKDGKPSPFNPLVQTEKNFISFIEFRNYLISLYKNDVVIFSRGEQSYDLVEKIKLEEADGDSKFMVASKNRVIIAAVNSQNPNSWKLFVLKEKPYTEQMESLINKGQYDSALEKLIENVPEDDEEKPQKIENYFLDCAWDCLSPKRANFTLAAKYISLTNFNPFEFIYMFYDSLSVEILHDDKKQQIQDNREKNQISSIYEKEEDIKKMYSFLINILTSKRDYILNTYKSPEDDYKSIKFLSSKLSIINLSDSTAEISVQKTLNSINSTLIKSMIKLKKNPKEIESVIDNKSINFSMFDDFKKDQFFIDGSNIELNETKFTLAYIAEKRSEYEEALKTWKFFGFDNKDDSNDKKGLYAFEGRDRTKKIFYRFKDTKNTDRIRKESLFRDYIQWLLIKYPNEAFEIAIKTEMVGIKIFMDEIIPKVESSSDYKNEQGKLKELFLEYFNQNQQSENYQTQLLELYAEKMFSYCKKDEPKINLEIKGQLEKYYSSFMKIIKDPKSCYNKKTILDYIEKSWLSDARIYLYSQLKEHDKALSELFSIAKIDYNFKDIEQYCKDNLESKHDIFQNFYKLLSEEVKNELQSQIDKNNMEINTIKKRDDEDKSVTEIEKGQHQKRIDNLNEEIKRFEDMKKKYEAEMLRILKEYGSINNLDPIFALTYASDHWNICDNGEFYNYLLNTVREYTTQGNKYKLGKNLSEMGLIYKEKEALDYKKKSVTIDSEKTCDLCKNKISNAIFVVYPNLKVYHVKCARNLNIDPMTGVDFSKKKFI